MAVGERLAAFRDGLDDGNREAVRRTAALSVHRAAAVAPEKK